MTNRIVEVGRFGRSTFRIQRFVGQEVRSTALKEADLSFLSAILLRGSLSTSNHTGHIRTGFPMVTLLGAWRYGDWLALRQYTVTG